MAERHRARLVEQHRSRLAELLDRRGALDDDAGSRAAGEPELNAIGAARINGHGVATTKTASARTGSPETAHAETGDQSSDRQEDGGVAIGDPDEGRSLAARLLDQPHERGIGALRRRAQRAQLERRPGAARPASHLPAAADA